jgi:hypothetical protein
MSDIKPTTDEWSRLCQAAIRIKEIAPWEWMAEDELFGVQDPETGELGFISVMGALGEHFALAVYLGARGLYGFWELSNAEDGFVEIFYEIPQLQVSFGDRSELTPEDRQVIKNLGLKFRGQAAWPQFRSHRPGFFPWYLEAHEARFLTHALEQAADVALRVKQDPTLLTSGGADDYLARVPQKKGGSLTWTDQVVTVEKPEPARISFEIAAGPLNKFDLLSKRQMNVEIDLFVMPTPIGKKGERPSVAYALMVVDSASGMLLMNDVLTPDPTLEAMWGQIPARLVNRFVTLKIAPSHVSIRSRLLFDLLPHLAARLGFQIRRVARLPQLDEAKEALFQWLS